MGTADPHGGGKRHQWSTPQPVPFGDYALLHRVAIGGMAEVFLAQSRRADLHDPTVPIALKRILPHMAEDPEFRRMFIDEAQIAARLDHPNIVPIRRLGTVGDALFIAMEFVWGKDLLQIINRFRRMGRRIPAGMAAYVAYNMCGALAYAHDKLDPQGRPLALVHRDVSPQNVLVGYDGSVKLIDFGIARAATRQTKTQTGVLKGKFGYMSPEQVRGLDIDHRSDLFAVGTCLWEMITSERLFAAESDFATLERVRNADVDRPSTRVKTVPRDLEAIVMRTLACDRASRYQSARELRMALQSFLQSEPVPFDVSRLSTWMHHLFGEEIEREKGLTSSFHRTAPVPAPRPTGFERSVPTPIVPLQSRPGVSSARVFERPSEPPPDAASWHDDQAAFEELADEPTHIYKGADLEAAASGGAAPEPQERSSSVGPSAIRWDAPGPVELDPMTGRGPSSPTPLPRVSTPPPPPPAAFENSRRRFSDPLEVFEDDPEEDALVPGGRRRPTTSWLGSAERRWMIGAAVAATVVVAAMLAAILGS